MEYTITDGPAPAEDAGALLRTAWNPPVLFYTEEYMRWQLTFPGAQRCLSAMATEQGMLAGFAGSTNRRVRWDSRELELSVVSFVAVHPEFRGRGIAAELYRILLGGLRERGNPILTFAQAGSGGQRAIEKAYPAAGLRLSPPVAYPAFGCLVRAGQMPGRWAPCAAGEEANTIESLPCSAEEGVFWSAPTREQMAHYLTDPRGRILMVERDDEGNVAGAAFAGRIELKMTDRVARVTTVDSLWMRQGRSDSLPSLAAAAEIWASGPIQAAATVSLPNLCRMEAAQLRRVGIRQIATPYTGWIAWGDDRELSNVPAVTNLEIV